MLNSNKAVLLIIVLLIIAVAVYGWAKIRENLSPKREDTSIEFITPVPQITQTIFPSITPTPSPVPGTTDSTTKGGLKSTPTTGVNLLIPSLLSLSMGLSGLYILKSPKR